ncbi:division/cell wall cluster transcriptional repressor MraZ [Tsuneonella sp. HG222]
MADKPVRYNGTDFLLRGEKNRLAVPQDFRKDLVRSNDGEKTLAVCRHPQWKCLTGFGQSRIDTFDAYLDKEEDRLTRLGRDFNRDAMSMTLYGYKKVPFDASGRFVLNDDLAQLGNLRDEVFFVGAGEFFMMWAPDELYAMDGPEFEAAKIACRTLQAAAIKAKRK